MPSEIDYLKLLRRVDLLEKRIDQLEAKKVFTLGEDSYPCEITLKEAEVDEEALISWGRPRDNIVPFNKNRPDWTKKFRKDPEEE